jgi:hypothetical protein
MLEAAGLAAREAAGDGVPLPPEATGLVDAVPEGVSFPDGVFGRAHAPSNNVISANATKRTRLVPAWTSLAESRTQVRFHRSWARSDLAMA